MTQGIERVWELPGSKGGITVEVAVSEQYDTLQNISDVTLGLRVKSSQYYNYTYYLKGSLTLEGTQLVKMDSTVPTHYVQLPSKNTYDTVKKWSAAYAGSPWSLAAIPHNTDGSKTVALAIELKGYTSGGGGGSGWAVSTTLEIPLTHIPRASTLQATDGDIGGDSILTVTRRSADYTHTIFCQFGELEGYVDGNGQLSQQPVRLADTTIPFEIPMDFHLQMPDCAAKACYLTCTTYWGDVQVGEPQSAEFTVTASRALFSPAVTGSVEDCNDVTLALTGDKTVLVRHASTALCTIAAQPGLGATLVSQSLNGQMMDGQVLLEQVSADAFCFAVTDSRGYTAQHTVTPTVIPYCLPSCRVRAVRLEPTGDRVALTVSGSCFGGSFGLRDNSVTVTVTAGDQTVEMAVTLDDHGYSGQLELSGLDYRKSHVITVTAADLLHTLTQTVTVDKGLPVFDWGQEDFRFHVPVTVPMLNGHANLALAAYPVGAIFASADPADPATVLGGSWEPLETQLPFYLWKRKPDDDARLGTAVLGLMKLGT